MATYVSKTYNRSIHILNSIPCDSALHQARRVLCKIRQFIVDHNWKDSESIHETLNIQPVLSLTLRFLPCEGAFKNVSAFLGLPVFCISS